MSEKLTYKELELKIRKLEKAESERMKAEKALKKNEKFLKDVLRASSIGIAYTKDRKIIWANEAMEQLFGYGCEEEYLGMDTVKLFASREAYDRVGKMLFEQNKDEKIQNYDIRFVRKDGTSFHGYARANLIDVDDFHQGVITSIVDITDRKQAEEALRESEHRYRDLLSRLPIGIYRNTPGKSGRFILANEAIARMFGYESPEQFIQTNVSDLYMDPAERASFSKQLHAQGGVHAVELRLKKKDGSLFWASVSAIVVRNNQGEIEYFDGIIEDITERKKIELEIKQSEQKYRTVLEANPDPVVVYDIEGKVVYFNPAFTDVFGWTLEERLGKKNDDFVPEEAWRKTRMMIDNVLAGVRFSGIETLRYAKNGEIIPVSISGAFHKDQNGSIIGSIINLRDISEKKKMEAQLQQAQKMEAIGTLAGGIAHDFNNILFPVLGHTEMLLKDLPGDSPERDRLKKIYSGAVRAKDLVKQILTFSRQDTFELTSIEIHPIVKETLKFIRSTIPATIEIRQDIRNDCGSVKADATQIHQLVMNLITNAYHAMDITGGELNVSLKKIEIGDNDRINPDMVPGTYACLTVSDTGIGMNEKLKTMVFDPFFTTKEKGKGTGMGPAVVHGVVDRMKGNIQVFSKPGKGTQFNVYLPIEKRISVKQVSQTRISIQTGVEKILVVDDEEAIAAMEREMLEDLGYQVVSCTSSIEALDVFREAPDTFDMVITDMAMPKMSGEKLAIELMKIRPEIPILLCTGYSETMTEEKVVSLGIKEFLSKPITVEKLAQKIRDVLD